jgi:ATP-binding cassette subfamily B protein
MMIDRPAPEPAAHGGWIRRLGPFLGAHRRNVWIALVASVVGQGLMALSPLIQKVVIDDGIVARTRPVLPWLLLLCGLGLASFGAAVVRRWVGGQVGLDVQFDLRNAIYERLQRLDFAGHDQLQTGQLVSRASTDLALIQGLLAFLPILTGNIVMLVLSVVIMAILSPPLTVVMLVTLPLLVVVSMKLRRKVYPATWDAQQRAGEVAGVVDEAVAGVRVVKGFGQEDRELGHLADTASGLFSSRSRLVRIQAKFTSTLQTIPALAQVAVLALGGWLTIEGHLTLGTFLAFSAYLIQLVTPVRLLSGFFTVGQQARAGAERILDVLDANALVVEPDDAVVLPTVRGEVRFENVRFGYTRSEPVLDGFDLQVEPGEVVALVGTSGSGKSTVTALLPRFYDVADGRVLIDGHDVRTLALEPLRRQVGLVFEDAFLFSDTVKANIAYGRPEATDDEVIAAAEAAGAGGFIAALPEGYDTTVGERGLSLSGGQRQRLALARAILTDPRILVLDDATSAVDATTEEAIHDTLRELMRDRTTILIAHRRSTLRLARRIVVLDAGHVVAEGSHEELLKVCAIYRNLFSEDSDDLDGEGEATPLTDDGLVPPWNEGEDEATAEVLTPALTPALTPSAWPSAVVDGPVASGAVGTGERIRGGTQSMTLVATPGLLAQLDKLPPADDTPDVDVDAVVAQDDRVFRLRRFVRPWMAPLLLGLGLVVLDTVLTLLGPVFVSRAIDDGINQGDKAALYASVAMFLAAVLVDWGVVWAYTRVTGRTAERMLFALRVKIFGHMQRLSLDYYDSELDGRLMTRMTTDVEALSQMVQNGLINALVGVCTCIGVLVFLVVMSPPLALAAAVVLPPLALATWAYRRRSSRAYGKAREAIADVNANLQESLSGVRVTQAYVREDRNIARFRRVNARYLWHRIRAQRAVALYFPFVLLLSDLGAVAVLGAGSVLEQDGVVTAGVVIAFLLYLNQFFAPLQQLSQTFDSWQQAASSIVKIEELLSTPTSTPPPATPVDPGRVRGDLDLVGTHFRYEGAPTEAIAGVDLHIPAGQSVALVGETGAGKSTIVKLFARFYDPTGGAVTVDGIDLRDIDLGAFRRQLGVVPQEAFLFTGTIRDNIAYGRPDASDAEVEAAARAVGAHDLVASMPLGYLTHVSERGRSLSSGQRQLIALARARLVDPAILLLDEATSQLDLASEGKVQRAMEAAAEGRTTITVAHRLPTARRADRIIVVADGHLVEDGTHDELLAERGAYAELWKAFAESAGEGATAAAAPASN